MAKCNNCGEQRKKVKILSSCELTGVSQYVEMGECDCDDITGRMINFGEKPHYEEVESKKKSYPPHIQKKIDQLEELEEMNMALGLCDKIASVRHLIAKEIEEEEKIRKSKEYAEFAFRNGLWF